MFDDLDTELARVRSKRKQASDAAKAAVLHIVLKSWVYRDPKSIPPRQWLHAGHYIRGYLSATFGPGGLGKTSLQLIEAVGMACGCDLLRGLRDLAKLRVSYWNLEDPKDELDRRIAAILIIYEISPEEIGDRLFVNCDMALVIAKADRDGAVVVAPVVDASKPISSPTRSTRSSSTRSSPRMRSPKTTTA
jgi:AAA domain